MEFIMNPHLRRHFKERLAADQRFTDVAKNMWLERIDEVEDDTSLRESFQRLINDEPGDDLNLWTLIMRYNLPTWATVLDFDEATAAGLDGTGTDGDERFPYTLAHLTNVQVELVTAFNRARLFEAPTS